MAITLARAGFEVATAGSLAEARTHVGPFGLIIADVHLPNGDGRHLREDWPGVPMLVISGATVDDPPGLEQLPFLSKPFHPSHLVQLAKEMAVDDG